MINITSHIFIFSSFRKSLLGISIGALLFLFSGLIQAQPSYHLFESGHVRPMAKSPDGSQLFAVNTPDNRLEVYDISTEGLSHNISIPVGMEPVAVAAKSNSEVWVVNHLSDSVSIIDLSLTPPQVVGTLLVGDEPRDIVFAGTGGNRAFISTAHRGQHRTDSSIASVIGAGDPQLTTPGIERADVWLFDTTNTGINTAVGGLPLGIVSFFADTPRALTVSPDGNTVYVAAFKSGNQTTAINEVSVCNNFQISGGSNCQAGAPGGVLGPSSNSPTNGSSSATAPETGIIVKFNGTNWLDSGNRDWSSLVSFDLPDQDVFSFNANVTSPANFNLTTFSGIGTVLFNMAINPVTGKVYVSNTESPNHIRFEGSGDHGGSTVQGRLSETRITVIDPQVPSVSTNHLNQHIDYSKLHTENDPVVDAEIAAMRPHTLAIPMQITTNSTGTTVYLAAFGSDKIGVFNTTDLEDPNFSTNFDPTIASNNYISTAGGPSGFVLDETNNRLYVMQRLDHSIAEIDLTTSSTVATHAVPDPEPDSVKIGRKFLYDSQISSGNGESSCASCHIFGDMDDIAWNLGDPDGAVSATNNQPNILPQLSVPFHPMKGPMTTQTLRGMATHGAMHWRGDRVDGFFGSDPCNEASGAACSEEFSFNNFIPAFEGLLGKDGTITTTQMQQFTDFILQLRLPPNPVANLDGTMTSQQANAESIYFGANTDLTTCNVCHTLDPAQGFFGTGGLETPENEPQNFKVAHLRNLYQKVGMFGTSTVGGPGGNQIRGFGFLHDGSVGTINDFLSMNVFTLTPQQVLDMTEFMLAFPTDLAPIVGQQITLTANNAAVANPRINLLIQRAQATFTSLILGGVTTECDLIVKGNVSGQQRGWLLQSNGDFIDDQSNVISDSALRALASSEGPLTYTCAVPGTGVRAATDRDEDTVPDGNDNCTAINNVNQLNFDNDTEGDACDADDDNDELTDIEEIALGTNSLNSDTDGDGFTDGNEVALGSDPLLASSTPETIHIPALPWFASLVLLGLITVLSHKRLSARS